MIFGESIKCSEIKVTRLFVIANVQCDFATLFDNSFRVSKVFGKNLNTLLGGDGSQSFGAFVTDHLVFLFISEVFDQEWNGVFILKLPKNESDFMTEQGTLSFQTS